jgi:transketolase
MVRQDISYPKLNVKIIGSHTGAALGEYGVSHQAIEDVGCMRVLPHLVVIEPSDAVQADILFEKALEFQGPVYIRVGRNPSPIFFGECSGPILEEALKVAQLVKESVRVIDMPTIRPVDGDIIEEAAIQTGRICTVQDHFVNGGLKEEVLSVIGERRLHVQFDYIALSGFAESGSKSDLYEKYGLSANRIIEKLQLTVTEMP